ncbi:hypothetical protein CYMTET_37634 [Cymbomonas tetramitiformis]|uniref:RING-type domain-containing protein n=1 Tax=Cymbomonas tetramitiformis TaxID=36881 RepID=A0AAE0F5S9_9CHLO|nr:hypothetical protein CYMTET_37634 [Cymbomonas tetramitiformis]
MSFSFQVSFGPPGSNQRTITLGSAGPGQPGAPDPQFAQHIQDLFNRATVFGQGGAFGAQDDILQEILRISAAEGATGPPPASTSALENLKPQVLCEGDTEVLQDTCSICQDHFKVAENVVCLDCQHFFHKDCVYPWLEMHNSCPTCRKPVADDSPPSPRHSAPPEQQAQPGHDGHGSPSTAQEGATGVEGAPQAVGDAAAGEGRGAQPGTGAGRASAVRLMPFPGGGFPTEILHLIENQLRRHIGGEGEDGETSGQASGGNPSAADSQMRLEHLEEEQLRQAIALSLQERQPSEAAAGPTDAAPPSEASAGPSTAADDMDEDVRRAIEASLNDSHAMSREPRDLTIQQLRHGILYAGGNISDCLEKEDLVRRYTSLRDAREAGQARGSGSGALEGASAAEALANLIPAEPMQDGEDTALVKVYPAEGEPNTRRWYRDNLVLSVLHHACAMRGLDPDEHRLVRPADGSEVMQFHTLEEASLYPRVAVNLVLR